jgi:hypothetical protein
LARLSKELLLHNNQDKPPSCRDNNKLFLDADVNTYSAY